MTGVDSASSIYSPAQCTHDKKNIMFYRVHRNFNQPSKYHPIPRLFHCLQPEILPHLRHAIVLLVFLDENFKENCCQII